jgi:hypothetical protein
VVACFKPMHKFPLRRLAGRAIAAFLRGFLPLILLAGTMAGNAAAADAPLPSAVSIGPGLQFAVADFDGDHRPDLVGVQSGQSGVSRTNYWIQLQLSAAGRQTILLVAPSGGLQIAARDVNGDHIPDLILTATWLRQPVAIFINDGHGAFTRVEPTAFPEAFREPPSDWDSTSERIPDSLGVPPSSSAGFYDATPRSPHALPRAGAIAPSSRGFLPSPFLISSPGRAPPSAVPHL